MKRIMTAAMTTMLAIAIGFHPALAEISSEMMNSIMMPDKIETSLGTLEFRDGAPSKETVAKIYDNLDLMHAVEAFVNAYQGASTSAIFRGMNEAGIPNNEVLIFSELMDAKSLFLTANADTIYFWSNLDVADGPIVLETPPMSLGVIDDMWFNWVTDFGLPGPDRGAGGKYLFVPPGYKGELPESGYFVQKLLTTRALMLGRSFLENNDPKPPVELIRKTLKIYPYLPGGYGTSIGSALQGEATLARTPEHKLDWAFLRPQPSAKFHEGSGRVMNTVPPSDFSYFEMINELVQKEPVGALDPEIMGSLAAKASPDGSTTVYFSPTKPEGIYEGNWIQTDPKKGWNTLLRLYSPLESFFTKIWRPSEIELVK